MLDRLRARAQRSDEGFTLIELLIVIVILGILAAIVVFAVGGSRSQAQSSACNADQKTVETALEAYKANVGSYPTFTDQTSYALLTGAASPGPYLKDAPPVAEKIVWDSTTGNVSATGPGCTSLN